MLKRNNQLLAILLSVLLVSLSGCDNKGSDNVLWVVTDNNGTEHPELKFQTEGNGWTKWKDKKGSVVIFRGNHKYIEMEQKAN